jgi:endonuclease-8
MPEGPSIVILKELVASFKAKKVTAVSGNSKVEIGRALGQTVIDFKSWGKHFLICFPTFFIRIHFLLFGSYRINEERDRVPRLRLEFKKGFINFYACSVRIVQEDPEDVYDFTVDVMSDDWKPRAARKRLLEQPNMLVCDALLDQSLFAGSGNIIKNEVLYRIKVHPKTRVGALPSRKLGELIKEVRAYSFDFLKWKKAYVLRKHWLAHTKRTCSRCEVPLVKEYLGKHQRRTFYCRQCQVRYK